VPLTAIATEVDPPTVTGKVRPFVDARVKLSVVAVTVRLTCAVVAEEFVGVMVIVVGPDAAMLGSVEIVKVVVGLFEPVNVTLAGLKLHVAPVGRPVQLLGLKFTTIAVEPATGAIVSVAVADCPAETGVGVSVLAVSAKSGASVAFQATARLLASTEPRPPTRLYPVVESAFDAANPMTPPAGQITSVG
jgi:hypothetical protein